MTFYINTNTVSLAAYDNLTSSQSALQTSLERLSSGLRINSAKDDAAGIAIAARMTAQINGMSQANVNINDGISFLQTADSAMTTITTNLQRMRNLAVQSANGSNSATDRQAMNDEVQQLMDEIQRIATTTTFNGIPLLDGSVHGLQFQVGANANDTVSIESIQNMQLSQLGTSGAGSKVTGTSTIGALNAGDLTLNNVSVGASTAGPGVGEEATSAIAMAAAINLVTSSSGVSATAQTILTGSTPTSNTSIQDFNINGVDITSVGTGTVNLAAAINQASPSGIIASTNASGGLILTSSNGKNINIELDGTATNSAIAAANRTAFLNATGLSDSAVGTQASAAVPGVPAVPPVISHGHIIVPGIPGIPFQPAIGASYATTTGTITMTSQDTNGILIAGNSSASAGFSDGLKNQNSTTTVPGIATLDVATQGTAQKAISSIDSAILMINNSQAQIGAYENRFSSIISNIQIGLENLSASRSLIQDTNFALETGTLTKASILQKAGTAMLAQANSRPNIVLSLLK